MRNYRTHPEKAVTEARVERIRELRAKGMSFSKIAVEIGVTVQSVHRLAQRRGIMTGGDRPAIPLHDTAPPATRSPE